MVDKTLPLEDVNCAMERIDAHMAELRRLTGQLHRLHGELSGKKADDLISADITGTIIELPANAILLAKRSEMLKRQGLLESAVRDLQQSLKNYGENATLPDSDEVAEDAAARDLASRLSPIRRQPLTPLSVAGEATPTGERHTAGM
jgi:hypothetical protein